MCKLEGDMVIARTCREITISPSIYHLCKQRNIMLNIFYSRLDCDTNRFIFDNVTKGTVLLVPDQFSLQAEKDAFHYLKTDALMDVEVLSFSRLQDRVIRETGGIRFPVIDKQGRHMLLTKIMNDAGEDLKVYGKYKGSSAFLEMANNMISELKQCGIGPGELLEAKDSMDGRRLLGTKLQEIARIYQGYEEAIKDHYTDTEDLAGLFVSKIGESETVRDSVFWVYGFDVFSPKNLDALEMLIKHSKGVNVLLTYDEGGPDENLFSAVRETMDRLVRAGENVNIKAVVSHVPDGYRVRKDGELGHIERTLYAMPPVEYSEAAEHSPGEKAEERPGENTGEETEKKVRLVKAASVYAEGETAAAHVLELVRERGMSYSDIVIICNDKGERRENYKLAFARYGMELFTDEKRSIAGSGAATYILSLMETIAEGYRSEDVVRMLKTNLTDLGRDEIEELEKYAIDYRIRGAQWKKPFYKGREDMPDEKMAELEELRQRVIGPVLEFHEAYKSEKTVAGKILALYGFLERCGIAEKLEHLAAVQDERGELEKAQETAQIWNRLVGILDQMVEIIGEETISAGAFFKLLSSGIEAVEIGVLPPALDGLIMGTMQRTRTGNVKVVMVLGANEGILPMSSASGGLLSENERQTLMDVSGRHLLKTDALRSAEESLAIYRNLSRPECELYMSTSESSSGSESSRPSMIFERLRRMFPEIEVEKDIFAEKDPFRLIGSPESTMDRLIGAAGSAGSGGSDSFGGNDPEGVWSAVCRWYRENDPEYLKMIEQAMSFDGRVDETESSMIRELYSTGNDSIKVSPTRLQTFSGCPFAHFLQYGMRVRERNGYEVGPMELGDLNHRCMETFSRRLNRMTPGKITDHNSPWMNITKEETRKMIGDISKEIADGYKEGLMHETKAEEYRLRRVSDMCADSVWAAVEQLRKGTVSDMMCEVSFGVGKKLDPVKVSTPEGDVYIEGKIDRMDILPENKAKIMDYKSGNAAFDEDKARAGWRIQLMLYMRAAGENGYDPVASFYYNLKEPLLNEKDVKKDIESAVLKQYKMDGIVLNEGSVLSELDENIKEGKAPRSDVFVGGGHVLERESFDELVSAVSDKVDEMCREMMDGNIEIKPKRGRRGGSACDFCPYHGACKFDLRFAGCRYEYV